MKKLFLAVLFAVSFSGFAQENYIQVTVRDTVVMKPISYKYFVSLNEDEQIGSERSNTIPQDNPVRGKEKMKGSTNDKLTEIEKFLSKKGYKPTRIEKKSGGVLGMFGAGQQQGFEVTVKDKATLDKIEKEVAQLEGATGSISETVYADGLVYDEALYKKLIETAKKKAESLAGLSELKLGNIASITESTATEDLQAGMAGAVGKSGNPFDMFSGAGATTGTKSKSLTVRFYVYLH